MRTLLVIDFQNNDYLSNQDDTAQLAVGNSVKVLNFWRAEKLPVIHVWLDSEQFFNSNAWRRHRSAELSPIIDNTILGELTPISRELLIEKPDRSAFFGTALDSKLLPNQDIFCIGATTTGCVLATAIHGDALGYNMNFISDCIFDINKKRHNLGLEILAKFGKIINHNILLERFKNDV